MSIKPSSSEPMYKQIAQDLRRIIRETPLEVGSQLPTEVELMKKYEVSRLTIRKAISLLVEDNILTIQQGKGTFVKQQAIQMDLNSLSGFYDILSDQGIKPITELVSFGEVNPPNTISALFNCSDKVKLPSYKRLYRVGDTPLGLLTTYLSPKTNFKREQVENMKVYPLLQKELKITLKEAKYTIQARQATSELADLLQVPFGSPLLRLQRTTFCTKNMLWEATIINLCSDSYEFNFSIEKGRDDLKEYFGFQEEFVIKPTINQ